MLNPAKSRIFQDLVEYTGLHLELVWKRCTYAANELAIKWKNKKSVIHFYQTEDLYLFDLTLYQLAFEHNNIITQMVQQIKELGLKKVLEFGGGIGEFSLVCAENRIIPIYYDLDGELKKYALWRFQKHKQNINVAKVYPLNEEWDLVNVMDILEHLEKPELVISDLVKNARYVFCNPDEIKYNVLYPQHISKFSLAPHFSLVKGYLWKNNNKP